MCSGIIRDGMNRNRGTNYEKIRKKKGVAKALPFSRKKWRKKVLKALKGKVQNKPLKFQMYHNTFLFLT